MRANGEVGDNDNADAILSDSSADDGGTAAAAGQSCASEILQAWGIDTPADDLLVLLLPEPIVYLLSRGQWQDLLLRTSWHHRLVLAHGILVPSLPFDAIAWPPENSPTWEQVGMHAATLLVDDPPDLDAQDFGRFDNLTIKA